MKKLFVLIAVTVIVSACEPISSEDECSLESLFTASWWQHCI